MSSAPSAAATAAAQLPAAVNTELAAGVSLDLQPTPERLLQAAKRIVTRNRPPGDFDDTHRRAYLDRIPR